MALFGVDLATSTVNGTDTDPSTPGVQLPTTLGGTTVRVKDTAGTDVPARLFFVSSGQINFQMPENVLAGSNLISVFRQDVQNQYGSNVAQATERSQVAAVAPGMFTANSSGSGLASGYWERYSGQTLVGSGNLNAVNQGNPGETVFLILYGTGIRYRSSLSAVTATVGGVGATVTFVGATVTFAGCQNVTCMNETNVGLDQINLIMPILSSGTKNVVVTVDSKIANTAQVTVL